MQARNPSFVKWRTACASLANRDGYFLYCQPAYPLCGKTGVRDCTGGCSLAFTFQLETPRWAVLTAAIVAAGRPLPPAENPILVLYAIAACCVLSGHLSAVLLH
ncbi:p-hydroxybenzoic acid efflux subunit AaeB [Citrobacter freundii]|nr:p-hydroxybenzoic acid efflux subunit AaeB [Citrobacter freundii]